MAFAGVNEKDEVFAGMQISAVAKMLQTDTKKVNVARASSPIILVRATPL